MDGAGEVVVSERERGRAAVSAALREAQGRRMLTATALGLRAGIPRNTNLHYLRGERSVPADLLFAYARALDVDPGELIGRAAVLLADES